MGFDGLRMAFADLRRPSTAFQARGQQLQQQNAELRAALVAKGIRAPGRTVARRTDRTAGWQHALPPTKRRLLPQSDAAAG
jgi:hypothetical protein